VKVLHELGMREESIKLLEAINNQIAGNSLNSQVVRHYIAQESQQREEIHFTAKELNRMAIKHFQNNRLLPALKAIKQALQLSPNNVKLLFSQLKILIKIKQEDQDTPEHQVLVEGILALLSTLNFEGKGLTKLNELTLQWQKLN
jgi:tetratricopeptide (TPR) repeat protein